MTPHELAHARRRVELAAAMQSSGAGSGAPLGLGKRSSNLFRDRRETDKRRLDLSDFCHVLDIDTVGGWVDVEGLTT